MEDEYDMDELRPELWQTLPHDLLDQIMEKFEEEGLRLQAKRQVPSAEGLLYLSSAANDGYFVWNPLTRRYTRFTRPLSNPVFVPMMPDPTCLIALERSECPPPLLSFRSLLCVKVDVFSDTGNFHLIVGSSYMHSTTVMLVVKDSRCGLVEIISDVPHNYCFVVQPTLYSKEIIILGFVACPGGLKVLAYNTGLKRCSWILNIQNIRSVPNARSNSGKVLIASLSGDLELDFFVVRDTGPTMMLVPSPFPPARKGLRSIETSGVQQNIAGRSLNAVPEACEFFEVVRLRDGDIVHYICVVKRSGRPTDRLIDVSVWTHNLVNSSDRITDWQEWPLRQSSQLSSARVSASRFHIFKPSFLSPDPAPD